MNLDDLLRYRAILARPTLAALALAARKEDMPFTIEQTAAAWQFELSPRQHEVLQLLADGHSNQSAAAFLHLSEETIKSHVRHVLFKLDVSSRTHAVAVGFREGMLA